MKKNYTLLLVFFLLKKTIQSNLADAGRSPAPADGNKFGIKTAQVLSGNTNENSASQQIMSTGIIPDFICRFITT